MPKKTAATSAKPGWEHVMKDTTKSEYETSVLSLPLPQRMKEAGAW